MTLPNLAKPSRLTRDVSKWERKRHAEKAKDKRKRQAHNKWMAISALVKHRDHDTCRACDIPTYGGGDPRRVGAAHHIVYRSAGGSDDLSNLVWLCAECHDDEHAHRLILTGTASNLNGIFPEAPHVPTRTD